MYITFSVCGGRVVRGNGDLEVWDVAGLWIVLGPEVLV